MCLGQFSALLIVISLILVCSVDIWNPFVYKCACVVPANLEVEKMIEPTPVQMQVLPAALSGRDLLVGAQTGSGKSTFPFFCSLFVCPFSSFQTVPLLFVSRSLSSPPPKSTNQNSMEC